MVPTGLFGKSGEVVEPDFGVPSSDGQKILLGGIINAHSLVGRPQQSGLVLKLVQRPQFPGGVSTACEK